MRAFSSDVAVADHQPRAPEIVERRDTAAVVRARIAEIATPREADAIEGYFYEGEVGTEVGGVLGISRQRVYQLLNTAATWLRQDEALAALA